MPVRIGMMVADERKYAPVFKNVMKAKKIPMTNRAEEALWATMNSWI